MSEEKGQNEPISIELEDAAKLFFKNRTAIFIDYSRGILNPFGTGVFAEIDGVPYVFSACHVYKEGRAFSDVRIASFVVSEKNGDNVLKECWKVEEKDYRLLNTKDGVEVDLMAVKIPGYVLEKYPEIFTHEKLIDPNHIPAPEKAYHVAGYPNELYRPGAGTVRDSARITMMAYGTALVENDKWDTKYHRDFHFLLEYPEEMATFRKGILDAPSPKGMSGGGIWEMVKTGTGLWVAEKKCRLVGIQFEWKQSQRTLIGSHIRFLYEALKEMHRSER